MDEKIKEKTNKNKTTGFFKKVWWSITKISKYDKMMGEGLKRAIKYFLLMCAILATILAFVGSYIQEEKVSNTKNYLIENVPEFSMQKVETKEVENKDEEIKYELNLENNEAIILDDSKFIDMFGQVAVINTNIKEDEAITEYFELAKDKKSCIIFLRDKCIIVSPAYNPENEDKEKGIVKYTYKELLDRYINTENNEITKTTLLNYFNNISYTYYISRYFVSYFITLLFMFTLDIIVLSLAFIIANRILKTDMKKRKTVSLTIYSLTLPQIVFVAYLIISYFTKFTISFINILTTIIACIYIVLYFIKKRKNNLHTNK